MLMLSGTAGAGQGMERDAPLFPVAASSMAERVDALSLAIVGVSAFFTLLISVLILVLAIKYRRRPGREVGTPPKPNFALEIAWSAVPLAIVIVLYVWGAALYYEMRRPPDGAMEILVVGKQWMWKVQHPDGRREINELHVPAGRPIRLSLASEDVIHSFYVPAFRIKQDAVPGRTTSAWFEATRPGEYGLFCAEYCGTNHSLMRGRVVVLDPAAYGRWLAAGEGGGEPPAVEGRKIAERHGCLACHVPGGGGRGADLAGLYGRDVLRADGSIRTADEAYLRESILRPAARAGAMPSYGGRIGEEDLLRLLAWLKSLGRSP